MVTFKNNNGKRSNFRRSDRSFKNNVIDKNKFNSNFSNSEKFQRKFSGRNNHNASKLLEKYNNLAREALATGDKILSENYFQHADHFQRVLNEKDQIKKSKQIDNIDNSLIKEDLSSVSEEETKTKVI